MSQKLKSLIKEAVKGEVLHSNCCYAPFIEETDLCSLCKEHATGLAHVTVEVEVDPISGKLIN